MGGLLVHYPHSSLPQFQSTNCKSEGKVRAAHAHPLSSMVTDNIMITIIISNKKLLEFSCCFLMRLDCTQLLEGICQY